MAVLSRFTQRAAVAAALALAFASAASTEVDGPANAAAASADAAAREAAEIAAAARVLGLDGGGAGAAVDEALTLRELTPSNIRAAVSGGDNLLVAFVNPTLPHSAHVHRALHQINAHVARVGAEEAGYSVAFADCHTHRALLKWYGILEVPSLRLFPRHYPRNFIPVPYRDNKTAADYLAEVDALVAPTRGLNLLPPQLVHAVRAIVPDLARNEGARVRATLAQAAARSGAGAATAVVAPSGAVAGADGSGSGTEPRRDPRVAALRAAVQAHLARQRVALTAALRAQERVGGALLELADTLELEGMKGLARCNNVHQDELMAGNVLLAADVRDTFLAELAVLDELLSLATAAVN